MRLLATVFATTTAVLCAASVTLSAAEKPVMMLSYSEYIDPEIPKAYEAATGVKVQIDVYESQDDMLAKLQAGGVSQYDIVVATDVVVPTMIKLGLVQKLDKTAIPNGVNIMETFKNPAFDPGNTYSYPYQWGTVGLMYATAKVKGEVSWSLLFDEAKGLNTYTGKVVVEQGSMRINADRLVIHMTNRKPTRYVATGNPARYKQQPKPDEGDVVATGKELDYAVASKTLTIRRDAHVTRQGDQFQGDQLVYDTVKDLVTGSGGNGGRIRMIIQPQEQDGGTPAP